MKVALFAAGLMLAAAAVAQESEWNALSLEAEKLSEQLQYRQAAATSERALEIAERTFGTDHPLYAASLNNLGTIYRAQGDARRAEPFLQRAVGILERRFGPEHPRVAIAVNNLALVNVSMGRYAEAEALNKRAIAIWETLGQDGHNLAVSLRQLGDVYDSQGDYVRAESLYKRALAIDERTLGVDHIAVTDSLRSLADLYRVQRDYARSEALLKRAVAIIEKARGPEHPQLANVLHEVGLLRLTQGDFEAAEPIYVRVLAISERALGPDHPSVGSAASNLAAVHYQRERYEEAEVLWKRALAIDEKIRGRDHVSTAAVLGNLASLYERQRRYAEADAANAEALAIRERLLGPKHPDVALSLNNTATSHYNRHDWKRSLYFTRRASAVYSERITDYGATDAAARESASNRRGFIRHISLLSLNPGNETRAMVADEAFRVAQLEQASGTAAAVAKMAVRFAAADDALGQLVKRQQEASEVRAREEAILVDAATKPAAARDAAEEKRAHDAVERLTRELASLDAQIKTRFPQYDVLTSPEPLTIRAVQAMLRDDEALVAYAIGDDSAWAWIIRRNDADFTSIDVTAESLEKRIATVRAQLAPDASGRLPPVDLEMLYSLYRDIVFPVAGYLARVRRVMVVPAGPLQSLPFHMLVSSPPSAEDAKDYRGVDWLAKEYAFSVLPSVGSLRALRQFAKDTVGQQPFAGIGDPQLTDPVPSKRRGRSAPPAGRLFSVAGAARQAAVADVRAIKDAVSLPETADELRAMARTLNAGEQSLWLRDRATETIVKKLDLSKYRVIAFATHGVMAGEVSGAIEPGLILTPPTVGTVQDDGYLSAGEIAQFRLNADWVLLSACNTAAADGTPGAEGLSGLGKAFFHAGTRALLVSHWPVMSEATVPLTTAVLREYRANPGLGKAEAHRKAMVQLMNTAGHREYAHPLFWAPFVVVGD